MQNGTRGCCHHDGAAGMEVDRLAVAPFVYLAEIAFRYTSDNNRNPSDECTNGRSRAKIMMFTSRELPRENVAHHHRYLSLSLSLSLSERHRNPVESRSVRSSQDLPVSLGAWYPSGIPKLEKRGTDRTCVPCGAKKRALPTVSALSVKAPLRK